MFTVTKEADISIAIQKDLEKHKTSEGSDKEVNEYFEKLS